MMRLAFPFEPGGSDVFRFRIPQGPEFQIQIKPLRTTKGLPVLFWRVAMCILGLSQRAAKRVQARVLRLKRNPFLPNDVSQGSVVNYIYTVAPSQNHGSFDGLEMPRPRIFRWKSSPTNHISIPHAWLKGNPARTIGKNGYWAKDM